MRFFYAALALVFVGMPAAGCALAGWCYYWIIKRLGSNDDQD